MKSTAETYYKISLEHLEFARQMLDDPNYATRYYLTHFFAGVAVECMLRAFLVKSNRSWQARHDLHQIAAEAKFFDLVPKSQKIEFSGKFTILNKRWNSNHRYFTMREVERHLQRVGAEQNVPGLLLQNNAETMLRLATEIIKLGRSKW